MVTGIALHGKSMVSFWRSHQTRLLKWFESQALGMPTSPWCQLAPAALRCSPAYLSPRSRRGFGAIARVFLSNHRYLVAALFIILKKREVRRKPPEVLSELQYIHTSPHSHAGGAPWGAAPETVACPLSGCAAPQQPWPPRALRRF